MSASGENPRVCIVRNFTFDVFRNATLNVSVADRAPVDCDQNSKAILDSMPIPICELHLLHSRVAGGAGLRRS